MYFGIYISGGQGETAAEAAGLRVVKASKSDVSPMQQIDADRCRREGLAASTPVLPLG